MKKTSIALIGAAMLAALAGCTADAGDGDDQAPSEEKAPEVSTAESVAPKACIPAPMPVCDGTLICSGIGTCRRCRCL